MLNFDQFRKNQPILKQNRLKTKNGFFRGKTIITLFNPKLIFRKRLISASLKKIDHFSNKVAQKQKCLI